MYATDTTLPDTWIEFTVAEDKKLKGPVPAQVDLDKNNASKGRHHSEIEKNKLEQPWGSGVRPSDNTGV